MKIKTDNQYRLHQAEFNRLRANYDKLTVEEIEVLNIIAQALDEYDLQKRKQHGSH